MTEMHIPSHETQSSCRWAWYTKPLAVRICHGGGSGNKMRRK